ncbi:MAG: hypothetical protein DKM50_00210 [Candidatus Margulisiibacteriota bacterium]|nr:MAG: hypothetical protein A2X43_02645 [Candidatus Margulisbacteria bacterium GWD2_39_127]OGI02732.1 MAG: hypothetical protein A2X42_01680 [Candidatus Margulisbacteria bacterium GWF2_38_17]PZM84957.1 MAG: hypothetical protein DKM50_00210 [Candidatus Margulisiibacteriota bacterium]HAR63636.1 hypothetical protein [Candidatus Margulisiibacteriota bacterium]HCY36856.1 hypothetical protein [Candidatus Margulisiibacteriota bacterium]
MDTAITNTNREIIADSKTTILVQGLSGTGKTSFIIDKYVYLVTNSRLQASNILVLTNNSKNAEFIKTSIIKKLARSFDETWINTFYSFPARILRDYAFEGGAEYDYEDVNRYKSLLIIEHLIQDNQCRLSEEFTWYLGKKSFLKKVLDTIQWFKTNLITIDQLAGIVNTHFPQNNYLASILFIYRKYQEFLGDYLLCDHLDIVNNAYSIVTTNPGVKQKIQDQFKLIMVDHTEDMNYLQLRLLKEICAPQATTANFFYDIHQTLAEENYTGTLLDHIKRHFKPEEIVLSSIHRNSSLTTVAESIVSKKLLFPEPRPEIELYKCCDENNEFEFVFRSIKESIITNKHLTYNDFAIVTRNLKRHAYRIREQSRLAGIPCIFGTDIDFYNQKPVVLLFALIAFLTDESNTRFKQIIPLHSNDIPMTKLFSLEQKVNGELLTEICIKSDTKTKGQLSPEELAIAIELREFYSALNKTKRWIGSCTSITECIYKLYREYVLGFIYRSGNLEGLDSLTSLFSMVKEYETITTNFDRKIDMYEFLRTIEAVTLQYCDEMELKNTADYDVGVKILSMHQLKGEEFDSVFLVHFTEEEFPKVNSRITIIDGNLLALSQNLHDELHQPFYISPIVTLEEILEQEKRLLYISLTRAKSRVFISYPATVDNKEQHASSYLSDVIHPDNMHTYDGSRITTFLNSSEVEITLLKNYSSVSAELKQFLVMNGIYIDTAIFSQKKEELNIPFSDKRKYSASAIKTFLSCPKKFYYSKVLGLETLGKERLHIGTEVHRVLQVFHRIFPSLHGIEHSTMQAILARLLDRVWLGYEQARDLPENVKLKRSKKGARALFSTEIIASYYYKMFVTICVRYVAQTRTIMEGRTAYFLEKKVAFSLNGIGLYGVIDRVDKDRDGRYHIVDYKTSGANAAFTARSEKLKYINIDKDIDYIPQDFQMPLYYLASCNALKLQPESIEYYYLNQTDSNEQFKRMKILFSGTEEKNTAVISEDEINEIIVNLTTTIDRIKAGAFPSKPDTQRTCQQCDYSEICRESQL